MDKARIARIANICIAEAREHFPDDLGMTLTDIAIDIAHVAHKGPVKELRAVADAISALLRDHERAECERERAEQTAFNRSETTRFAGPRHAGMTSRVTCTYYPVQRAGFAQLVAFNELGQVEQVIEYPFDHSIFHCHNTARDATDARMMVRSLFVGADHP